MLKKTFLLCLNIIFLCAAVRADINTTLLLNKKQAPPAFKEGVFLPLPNEDMLKIKLGYHLVTREGSVFEWIPKTEQIENWSQLIQIQSFILNKQESAENFAVNFFKALKETIPGAKTNVIQHSKESVVLEWSLLQQSGNQVPQSEIARIISTNKGVYRIAFTKKTPTLDPQLREIWIKRLNGARVVDRNTPNATTIYQAPKQ